MSSSSLCGPCSHANRRKHAQKWCTDCEEGFCADCEQIHRSMMLTTDHTLVSTNVVHETENVAVIMNCDIHGKKFDLYCKTHDVAICVACIQSKHKHCSDAVISLDEAAKNSKTSTALDDMVDSINVALDSMKNIINNRNVAMQNIAVQEQTIRKSIGEMRANLNKHLDDIEKKLLDELSELYTNCKSKYGKVLKTFNKTANEIKLLQEQASQLKCVGSDLQVFLGTRQITKLINVEVQSVKSGTSAMQDYTIGIEMHPVITSLLEGIDNFGKIKVEEKNFSLPFKEAKIVQAQIVHTPVRLLFDSTGIRLRKKFKIKETKDETKVYGCVILPNSHILVAIYSEDKVIMEYSDDGRHIRDISVSDKPYDLAVIDSYLIAVSYDDFMEIMNIIDNNAQAKVNFGSPCWGISYQNRKIYIKVDEEGIVELDLLGNRLRTIGGKFAEAGWIFHITTTKDRIYCTDFEKDAVYCCCMTGEDIWTFTDESLSNARGISADGDENVFVVGRESNSLMMIQHDGKVVKTLLTESDCLNDPVGVHYNKDKQLLLICNQYTGEVFLYSVTKESYI
ncbi:uncharacterized protein LOC127702035 [Mytilus californianus]|uniref:uncharacterized protein LOC127702035 n=1 Tax=Mytilus californianus TaxID=6549 RepID=UPI00224657A5|nr:uncharacterized protein LOC127702035 [Mytilus californianus]XP_052061990.1 uncharacterized protein LOC127702035 [Mytilus californianus]